MKRIHLFLFAMIVSSIMISCKKNDSEPAPNPSVTGSLEVEFENFVGTEKFAFGTTYTNPNTNESFTPTMLRYFVSNIELKNSNGTVFMVPQNDSYFLIDQEKPESLKFTLNGIPEGDYNEISFTIGVDSLRNTKPVEERTGNLDISGVAQGMYWSWNSGYIFVKFEGSSPQSTTADKKYYYHIGGYGGYSSKTINCIRKKTLSFDKDIAKVRVKTTPTVHLITDVMKLFNGSTQVKIADYSTVMFGAFGVNVANNYVDMFTYDHVHND